MLSFQYVDSTSLPILFLFDRYYLPPTMGIERVTTVIALANQKGGVGKTTSTVNLAHALVQRGQRVLTVDMDPQSSLTIYYGQNPRILEKQEATLYWALMKDRDMESLILSNQNGSPDLIPASIFLSTAEPELTLLWDSASVFHDKLLPVRERYDFILVDCPPSLTLLTVNALAAADIVLVPVKTDYLSVMGIPLILDTVEKIRKRLNTRLRVFGVLPTMYNARNIHDNDCLAELKEILASRIRLFEPIHRSTGFDRSSAMSKATLDAFPDTPGVQVYHQLAEELTAYGQP